MRRFGQNYNATIFFSAKKGTNTKNSKVHTFCSASYIRQTQDQKLFTIPEVATAGLA